MEKAVAKWEKKKSITFDNMTSIFFHYVRSNYNCYISDENIVFAINNSFHSYNNFYYQLIRHRDKIIYKNKVISGKINIEEERFDINQNPSSKHDWIKIQNNNSELQAVFRKSLRETLDNFLYLDHDLDKAKSEIKILDIDYKKKFICYNKKLVCYCENSSDKDILMDYLANAQSI